jgi:hypothetical protein
MNSNPSGTVSEVGRSLLSKLDGLGCGQCVFVFSSSSSASRFLDIASTNTTISNTRTNLDASFLSSYQGFGVYLPSTVIAKASGSFASVRVLRYEDPYLTELGTLQSEVHELIVDGSSLPNFQLCNRFPGASTFGNCYASSSETTLVNLVDPLTMNITVDSGVSTSEASLLECQFYNTSTGNFSDEGCTTDASPFEAGEQYVQCTCSHATAFAVSLTIQAEAPTCADLDGWKPVYQTQGYKAWLGMLLTAWAAISLFLVGWVISFMMKPKTKVNITFFTNAMLLAASCTRVLFFSLMLDAWSKTDNIACVEFGYNNPNLPVPPKNMNVIYDIFFPFALVGFSSIFLYWYELANVMGHSLGKMKSMRFLSGVNLWVRALASFFLFDGILHCNCRVYW